MDESPRFHRNARAEARTLQRKFRNVNQAIDRFQVCVTEDFASVRWFKNR
jgi:hypothetical protein